MKPQIDIKSAIIGFIIGVAVLLQFHIFEPGTYQKISGSYILNTQTGKVLPIKFPHVDDWRDITSKTNIFDQFTN